MADLVKTFNQTGDFEAMNAAEHFLKVAGFSIGSSQRGSPRGIMFGDVDISKWRNLRQFEIDELHGAMTGDGRNGPLTVRIRESAPQEAKQAFHKTALALR